MFLLKKLVSLLLAMLLFACNRHAFNTSWTKEVSPPAYNVRFKTTKGVFEMHIERQYSPYAADRLYQLVKHKNLNNVVFYRVVPKYVAQFGLSDTIAFNNWNNIKLPDEKVKYSNKRGTISFASGGPQTRGTDLFINLKDNQKLDTLFYDGVRGFPAFGTVIKGMEVVDSLYSGYSNGTLNKLDTFYANRKKFLQIFPRLDKTKKVYILH